MNDFSQNKPRALHVDKTKMCGDVSFFFFFCMNFRSKFIVNFNSMFCTCFLNGRKEKLPLN